jgi:hypothetical protein
MNKPSSTITAASLAAAGVTLIWMLIDNFSALSVSAGVVSGSTAFVAAVFGYFRKETVLPIKRT